MTKRICLSGADMYELEEVFAGRRGIISVRTGYINAAENARHEDVATGAAGGRMGIEIAFDLPSSPRTALTDRAMCAAPRTVPACSTRAPRMNRWSRSI